jgi:hypothetical protein
MRKGQFTIYGIIMMFVMLVVFSVIYPIQNTFIKNVTDDPATSASVKTLLPFTPILEVICILMFPIIYSRIQRPEGEY